MTKGNGTIGLNKTQGGEKTNEPRYKKPRVEDKTPSVCVFLTFRRTGVWEKKITDGGEQRLVASSTAAVTSMTWFRAVSTSDECKHDTEAINVWHVCSGQVQKQCFSRRLCYIMYHITWRCSKDKLDKSPWHSKVVLHAHMVVMQSIATATRWDRSASGIVQKSCTYIYIPICMISVLSIWFLIDSVYPYPVCCTTHKQRREITHKCST